MTSRSFLILIVLLVPAFCVGQSSFSIEDYKDDAAQIIDRAAADGTAFSRLTYFVDRFPRRLSGSDMLEDGIDWILSEMRSDGLDNVHGQPVVVPHWVRNEESLHMLEPDARELPMLGLGGSIGTPAEGIEAEVFVVSNFAELEENSDSARGRIVLFNAPFTSYGATVQYRWNGAVAAARHGAVASLIRSVTPYSMQTPHTGSMSYDESVAKIPHAAITIEDAEYMARAQTRGHRPVVNLKMNAQNFPPSQSRNVIAELRGSERPDEIVVMGGHIDAWDVGQGAMDDAGGCIVSWEAIRLLKELGLRPKRTIRVVLWTNEENGLGGAREYRTSLGDDISSHVLAIESDAGVFRPTGFGFSGSDSAFAIIQAIGSLLDPIDAGKIERGGGGADIGPLMHDGVPGMGLKVERDRYFWYHHSHADTMDKLDSTEVANTVAAMAVMSYVVADMPTRLPR